MTEKALAYANVQHVLFFLVYGAQVVALLALAHFRVFARVREAVLRRSRFGWLSTLVCIACAIAVVKAIGWMGDGIGHALAPSYDVPVPARGAFLRRVVIGGVTDAIVWGALALVYFALVRRNERARYAGLLVWFVTVPLIGYVWYLKPEVIEPHHSRLVPMAPSKADLVRDLNLVLARAGLSIPAGQFFIESDSDPRTEKAQIEGALGESPRVVVGDVTVSRLGRDDILWILAHMLGHRTLYHPLQDTGFRMGGSLVLLLLLERIYRATVARHGTHFGINGGGDPAGVPLLFAWALILRLGSTPIENVVYRHQEQVADSYGLETLRGLVPSPASVAARGILHFDALAPKNPSPGPVELLWFHPHPPLNARLARVRAFR